MKIMQALKMIVLTPFAYWIEIVMFIFGVSVFATVVWFWSLVFRALLKYLAN